MGTDGGTIENPVSGERITFTTAGMPAGSEPLEFKLTLEPRPAPVPEHIHARQEEHIEVTSGTVLLRLGGEEQQLAAGASMTLPPGVAHTLWNNGDADARLLVQVRPGLKTKAAIETLFGLARDGKSAKDGGPTFLQAAVMAGEYHTYRGAPAIALQKVLLTPIAPIARLLGYRPRYPEYSEPDGE